MSRYWNGDVNRSYSTSSWGSSSSESHTTWSSHSSSSYSHPYPSSGQYIQDAYGVTHQTVAPQSEPSVYRRLGGGSTLGSIRYQSQTPVVSTQFADHSSTHAYPSSYESYSHYSTSNYNPPPRANAFFYNRSSVPESRPQSISDKPSRGSSRFPMDRQNPRAPKPHVIKPSNSRAGASNNGPKPSNFGSNWEKPGGILSSTKLTVPDFEKLNLPDVKKDFYSENDSLYYKSEDEVEKYLKDHQISVSDKDPPRPCMTFEDIDLPEAITKIIKEKKFEKPTPIQAQAWPLALSGDDIVGLAQTGSGKTCAFVIPGLVHIQHNREPDAGNYPIMLVLCPTRELSQQVFQLVEEFASPSGLSSICLYGGAPRSDQANQLRAKHPNIIVATPGRLLDFMESKEVEVTRVSYLVLDEADRMLDMGFEPQIRRVIQHTRPDRQTLMFSATWPDAVWQLAEDFLDDYIKINIGSERLSANHQITQVVECCEEGEKPDKILELLSRLFAEDKNQRTLIFCDTKKAVNELGILLEKNHIKACCIHGNKKQSDRELVLKKFADNQVSVLVATDVAARGLDIADIKYVINYDYPNNSEDYVHRIGRTARSNATGVAYTFFTQDNMGQSGKLISILEEAGQECPTMLRFYANFVKQR